MSGCPGSPRGCATPSPTFLSSEVEWPHYLCSGCALAHRCPASGVRASPGPGTPSFPQHSLCVGFGLINGRLWGPTRFCCGLCAHIPSVVHPLRDCAVGILRAARGVEIRLRHNKSSLFGILQFEGALGVLFRYSRACGRGATRSGRGAWERARWAGDQGSIGRGAVCEDVLCGASPWGHRRGPVHMSRSLGTRQGSAIRGAGKDVALFPRAGGSHHRCQAEE